MRPFGLAGLQLPLAPGDNFDAIAEHIGFTKRVYPWIDVIVLSELCWLGADTAKAVTLPGPYEDRIRELARRHKVWLVAGSLYERDGDRIYNTCPVLDPNGDVVTRARKLYPFLPYEKGVDGGDAVTVFDIPGVGRFGLSICYDMWFPETVRTMVWQGAGVILHPSMTTTIDRDVETAMARSNAAMQQCYFVDVNVVGMGGGRSGVYGPGGEIIHQASSGMEIIPVELDLNSVKRVRERGWHGLGQVLKSFRDADLSFEPYSRSAMTPAAFGGLGPMRYPARGLSQDPDAP